MFERALCDLGASVSIMPRNVFEKLRLPEPEPTAMCLELADNSVRYPLGIAEDMPVKIGEHLVPVDFFDSRYGRREQGASHSWEAFPQDRKGEHQRWQGGDKVQHQWHHKRIQVLSTP